MVIGQVRSHRLNLYNIYVTAVFVAQIYKRMYVLFENQYVFKLQFAASVGGQALHGKVQHTLDKF